MTKPIWAMGVLSAVAAASFACSSNSGSAGGGGGGVACLLRAEGMSCESCLNGNCSSQANAIGTACGDYLDCLCSGGNFDPSRVTSCTPSSSCQQAQMSNACTACQRQCTVTSIYSSGSGGGSSSSSGGSGSGGGGSFGQQFCSKLSGCGQQAQSNCQLTYSSLVLSSSCQQALLGASCTDLTASPIPDLQGCIPPCSTSSSYVCSGREITGCLGGGQFTFECTGVCASVSKTYTGTCAASYMGMTSTTGQSCWCQ